MQANNPHRHNWKSDDSAQAKLDVITRLFGEGTVPECQVFALHEDVTEINKHELLGIVRDLFPRQPPGYGDIVLHGDMWVPESSTLRVSKAGAVRTSINFRGQTCHLLEVSGRGQRFHFKEQWEVVKFAPGERVRLKKSVRTAEIKAATGVSWDALLELTGGGATLGHEPHIFEVIQTEHQSTNTRAFQLVEAAERFPMLADLFTRRPTYLVEDDGHLWQLVELRRISPHIKTDQVYKVYAHMLERV